MHTKIPRKVFQQHNNKKLFIVFWCWRWMMLRPKYSKMSRDDVGGGGVDFSFPLILASTLQRLKKSIVENFFLFGFSIAAIIALSYPVPGKVVGSWQHGGIGIIDFLNNCVVFFISGVTLKIQDLATVLQHKGAIVYGLVNILLVSTLLAFGLILIPFKTPAFAVGLTIFVTVPTTLGVGVALTQAAKGDTVLALLLTTVSNMLGILTVPFLLHVYLKNVGNMAFNVGPLVLKLSLTVLVPSLVGMAIRRFVNGVEKFTRVYKAELSMLSTSNLAMIVWMALSASRELLLQQSASQMMLVLVVAATLHIVYLCFNFVLLRHACGMIFDPPQFVAVLIMSSQKSSPVALAVITSITKNRELKGMLTIPCIIGQLCQIFIGSAIVNKLSQFIDEPELAPAPSPISMTDDDQGLGEDDGNMISKVDDVDTASDVGPNVFGIKGSAIDPDSCEDADTRGREDGNHFVDICAIAVCED